MSKFTEHKLEQAFCELLAQEGYPHSLGITLPRQIDEVLRLNEKKVIPELELELEFDFHYDVCSFLGYYSGILSKSGKSGLERVTCINQKQLWHYSSGNRYPKPATARKIQVS